MIVARYKIAVTARISMSDQLIFIFYENGLTKFSINLMNWKFVFSSKTAKIQQSFSHDLGEFYLVLYPDSANILVFFNE